MQVPLARGSVMPEIASIREDFPALCQPITAIVGMSKLTSTLQYEFVTSGKEPESRYAPESIHASEKFEHGFSSCSIQWFRQTNGLSCGVELGAHAVGQ